MASIVFVSRGIKQYRDLFIKFMETQMFWWKRKPLLKDKNGEFIKNEDGTYKRGAEETTKVQGALRPIELWEYTVPIECVPEVLATWNQHKNAKHRPEISNFAWMLRKMLRLKPIPKMPKEIAEKERWQITDKYIPMEAMAAYPIGIKEDKIDDIIFPNGEGWYQEHL